MGHDCCGHGHHHHKNEGEGEGPEEEMLFEQVAMLANDKIDVLIELLVSKGIITSEEYDSKFDEYMENMEDDDDEGEEE